MPAKSSHDPRSGALERPIRSPQTFAPCMPDTTSAMPSPRSSPAMHPKSPLSPRYETARLDTVQPPSPRAVHHRTNRNSRSANKQSTKLPTFLASTRPTFPLHTVSSRARPVPAPARLKSLSRTIAISGSIQARRSSCSCTSERKPRQSRGPLAKITPRALAWCLSAAQGP